MLALLPVTPKLLFLGYDGDVYQAANVHGVIDIRYSRDVIAFNRHQFLQCVANIYVHDARYEDTIQKHYTDIEAIRPKCHHVIHYAEKDIMENGYTRFVVTDAQ